MILGFRTADFVSTAPPGSVDDERLLKILFARQRTTDWIDGVLVLSPAALGERVGPRLYFAPAAPFVEIDLSEFLIGVCLRQEGIWTYSEGIYLDR